MKILNRSIPALLASLACLSSAQAHTITINEESLRTLITSAPTDSLSLMKDIYSAKSRIAVARADLAPMRSSNIGSAPSFGQIEINYLLPMLLPAKWNSMKPAGIHSMSDAQAFDAVRLDAYASALAIEKTVVSDLSIGAIYHQQTVALTNLVEIISNEVKVGTELESQLSLAQAQAELAQTNEAQWKDLIAQETADVRQMLHLPASDSIQFETDSAAVSPAAIIEASSDEKQAPAELRKQSVHASPEIQQLESLNAFMKTHASTQEFAYVSGANTLGWEAAPSAPSFATSSGIEFGFETLPEVALQSSKVSNALFSGQKAALQSQIGSTLNTILSAIARDQLEISNATVARDNYDVAWQAEVIKFKLGEATQIDVLTVANFAMVAKMNLANYIGDLKLQRVNLQRLLVHGEFAKIKMCAKNLSKDGEWSVVPKDPKKAFISLDALCQISLNN